MRKTIIVFGYGALLISLGFIALTEPAQWPFPILMLITLVFVGLIWRATDPTIGIHEPTILISSAVTLCALLFKMPGVLASISGVVSIGLRLAVYGPRARIDRIYDRVDELQVELASKFGVPKPSPRVKRWRTLTMPRELDDIEKLKLDLEVQRLAWQKAVDMEQSSFVNNTWVS